MNGDINAKYDLAKKFSYGNGVERDYEQAQMWYGLATAVGHSFAKYELGKMDLYGIGIEQNQELGTEYCLDAYWGFRASVEKSYGFDVGSSVYVEALSGEIREQPRRPYDVSILKSVKKDWNDDLKER